MWWNSVFGDLTLNSQLHSPCIPEKCSPVPHRPWLPFSLEFSSLLLSSNFTAAYVQSLYCPKWKSPTRTEEPWNLGRSVDLPGLQFPQPEKNLKWRSIPHAMLRSPPVSIPNWSLTPVCLTGGPYSPSGVPVQWQLGNRVFSFLCSEHRTVH